MKTRPTPNDELERRALARAQAPEEVLEVRRHVVEQRTRAGPVERRDADRHEQQRRRPRHGVEADRAGARQAGEQHPVAAHERREAREQREVGAERVGVARPRLDAVEAHPHERGHEVAEPEQRQRHRLAPAGPAQLADAEEHDPGGGRPAPEPLGVGQRLRRVARGGARHHPPDRATDRAPRAEQAEDVAEQQRDARHADPERHEDRVGGEVVLHGVRPRQAGVDDGGERSHPDDPEHDVDHDRQPHQPPLARLLQPRRRPQRGQRHERQHEHERRGGREERLGDRQVGPADQAMGEDGCGEQHAVRSLRTTTAPPERGRQPATRSGSCELLLAGRRCPAADRTGRRDTCTFGLKVNFSAEVVLLARAADRADEVVLAPLGLDRGLCRSTSDENTFGGRARCRSSSILMTIF